MQSVVWMFVRRINERIEKKSWDFSERTMRSERENDV